MKPAIYNDLEALRAAVVEYARHEVAKKLGRSLDGDDARRRFVDGDLRAIVDRVGSVDDWNAYKHAARVTSAAVEALGALVLLDASDHWKAKLLERAEDLLRDVQRLPKAGAAIHKLSHRSFVGDPSVFAKRDFWWSHGPSPRDRALISILAGNFPTVSAIQLRKGITIAKVLESETKAIRQALAR